MILADVQLESLSLYVQPTCLTSARLIGRPVTLLDVHEGVLGVHNRPHWHFPLPVMLLATRATRTTGRT